MALSVADVDSVDDFVIERAPSDVGQWLARGEGSDGRKKPRKKRTGSPRGAVFPSRRLSWWRYKTMLAQELQAIADEMSEGKQRRDVVKRAKRSLLCGRVTKARACRACSSVREGSGVQTHPEGGYPCQLRTCATCARRSAQRRRQEIKAIVNDAEAIPPMRNHTWKLITLTMCYDPTAEADVTIEALRERVRCLRRSVQLAWKRGLKRHGTALVATIELSGVGNVHCHCLYYGPYVEKDWLEATIKEVSPNMGHTDIRQVSEEKQNKAILEVAKYLGKSPSPLSERWIEGDEREVLHPRLAARWEVATMKQHLTVNYGAFRNAAARKGLSEVDEADDERRQEADADIKCEHCCTVGQWHWIHRDTIDYVREMHLRGLRAFSGSRWTPPRAGPRAEYGPGGTVILVGHA